MAKRNWEAIAAAYIEGGMSLRALSREQSIPWSTLRDRARREGWDSRRQLRQEGRHVAAHPGAEQTLHCIVLRSFATQLHTTVFFNDLEYLIPGSVGLLHILPPHGDIWG